MRILFLGTHGQKNWGDELLLKTFVRNLSPLADKIYVNSYNPKDTQKYLGDYQNITTFDTKKHRAKLMYYLLRSDAVVFGGGSILKELYTAYGGKRYATLNVIDYLTRIAHGLRKPIYFCNIGIGPIETKQGLDITRRIVNRATMTTVRDGESLSILEQIQPNSQYALKSDAVFSVSRQTLGLQPQKNKKNKSAPLTIGINLCRNIENNDNWEYFISQLTNDLLAWCKKNPDTRIVGIPMQYSVDNNNDATELKMLGNMLLAKNPRIDYDVLQPRSIEDIGSAIDAADIIVAERLHALILSIIAGTPIVALEYDVKVKAIIKDLGLSNYSLDINEEFMPTSILKRIKNASNTQLVQQDLASARKIANTLSLSSFNQLTSTLKDIEERP